MDRTLGFDEINAAVGATVAPEPMNGCQEYPGMYLPPPEPTPSYPAVEPLPPHSDMAPIGFEMHGVHHEGPTEIISEKVPLEPKGDVNDEDNMYFNDGIRRIDYVLAYEPDQTTSAENRKGKREYYEKMLTREGLQLEYEDVEKSKSGKVAFVKIHAPWDVLAKGAEIMNMKMPLAPNDMGFGATSIFDCIPTPFDLDKDLLEEDDNYFTAPFNRNRMEQFVINDRESFFTNAQRSRIVYTILARTFYEDTDPENPNKRRFGIKKLLANRSYTAAYPLHDGKYKSEHSLLTEGKLNNRHLLYELWARPGRWYKFQPLDKIRARTTCPPTAIDRKFITHTIDTMIF